MYRGRAVPEGIPLFVLPPSFLHSFPVSNRGTPSRLPFPNLNNLGTEHFVLQNTPVQGRPV